MANETPGVRLGDLLTGAGLLEQQELREAIQIAKHQSLPVGRVLIMSGYLTENQLQSTIQAQSLLKDGLIDLDLALQALRLLAAEALPLDAALDRLGFKPDVGLKSNKLGELLVAAQILDNQQLHAALLQCHATGMPLGRVLVITKSLTEAMLMAALNAQVLIRDKKLTRDQAIQGLKASRDRQIPLEQFLLESGNLELPIRATVRLGELLLMAGLLDESRLMDAVEMGLVEEKPIGRVLIELGIINDDTLQAALTLQEIVASGRLNKTEAQDVLKTTLHRQITITEALGRLKPKAASKTAALPLYLFLQLSGLVNAKQIEEAIKLGSRNSQIMAKMLLNAGIMEPLLIDSAVKCHELIEQNILNTEHAIIALSHCQKNQTTLDQAFQALGWQAQVTEGKAAEKAQNRSLPDDYMSIQTQGPPSQAQQLPDTLSQENSPPAASIAESPANGNPPASDKPEQQSTDEEKPRKRLIDLVPKISR